MAGDAPARVVLDPGDETTGDFKFSFFPSVIGPMRPIRPIPPRTTTAVPTPLWLCARSRAMLRGG